MSSKISSLPVAGALAGDEQVAVVQDGITKRTGVQSIADADGLSIHETDPAAHHDPVTVTDSYSVDFELVDQSISGVVRLKAGGYLAVDSDGVYVEAASPGEANKIIALDGSGHLEMPTGGHVKTDTIQALGSSGLEILDDEGNYAIYVNDGGQVTVGTNSIRTIIGTVTHFAGVTPAMEIVTGVGTDAYEECVVIRHLDKDSDAETRRLGLLLKLNYENTDTESKKMGGLVLDSEVGHANKPYLHLMLHDEKRLTVTENGIGIDTVPDYLLDIYQGTGGNGSASDYYIRNVADNIGDGSSREGSGIILSTKESPSSGERGIAILAKPTSTYGQGIKLEFRIANNDLLTSTPLMVLDKDGNLGLNETTPDERLHVNGRILIRDPEDNGALIISPSTGGYGVDPELYIQAAETGSGNNSGFHISRNAYFRTSDDTYRYVDTGGQYAAGITFEGGGGDIVFNWATNSTGEVTWTEMLRLDGDADNAIFIGTIETNLGYKWDFGGYTSYGVGLPPSPEGYVEVEIDGTTYMLQARIT